MNSSATFSPHHAHEPEIAPALDAEGRCLVCVLLVERARLRETLEACRDTFTKMEMPLYAQACVNALDSGVDCA